MTSLFGLLLALNTVVLAASGTLFSFGGKWWKQNTGDDGYLTSEFRQVLANHLTRDFLSKIKGGERPIYIGTKPL